MVTTVPMEYTSQLDVTIVTLQTEVRTSTTTTAIQDVCTEATFRTEPTTVTKSEFVTQLQ